MPPFRYADLPSLDHVAYHWALRRGLDIGVDGPPGAQRALEIMLDALPVGVRRAARAWSVIRRRYCEATNTADPRKAFRQTGYWATWLARRGLTCGDLISAERAAALRAALVEVGRPFHGIITPPDQEVWRRHGWAGVNNFAKAVVVTALDGGREYLLDIVPTRTREAMRERGRLKNRERYRALTRDERQALISQVRVRRRRARRAFVRRQRRDPV